MTSKSIAGLVNPLALASYLGLMKPSIEFTAMNFRTLRRLLESWPFSCMTARSIAFSLFL